MCSKCKEEKNIKYFSKDKGTKDGLNHWCKKCGKEYYENNKERKKDYQKEYDENNRKQKKEYRNSPLNFNSKLRKEMKLYEKIKESENGNLMCKCAYCGEWFEPTRQQIQNRLNAINGMRNVKGEGRLYCSQNCKNNCPIYWRHSRPKDQKPASSREVQPELRQIVFKRDNYTCQKCNTHRDNLEVGIHCHHKEGILWEPLLSADIDMCITLCEDCHKEVHQKEGCGYHDMQCK